MIEFKLPAMSCGHCARAVAEAVKSVDPQARVEVDLAEKRAQVETTRAREAFVPALEEAGYPPA